MELEPKSLDIRLNRTDRWGLVLIGACALAAALTWFVDTSFARALVASCIVVLPALWLFLFPRQTVRTLIGRSGMPRLLSYLFLFGYFALAKSLLVPLVLRLLEHAVA